MPLDSLMLRVTESSIEAMKHIHKINVELLKKKKPKVQCIRAQVLCRGCCKENQRHLGGSYGRIGFGVLLLPVFLHDADGATTQEDQGNECKITSVDEELRGDL